MAKGHQVRISPLPLLHTRQGSNLYWSGLPHLTAQQTPVCEFSERNENVTNGRATLPFTRAAPITYLTKYLRNSGGKTKN